MQITQTPITLHPTARHDAGKIDQAARQLEAQFAQLLVKSMRDASFGDALFPGENQLFREMYDQQLAQALTSGKGLGIATMVARQLGKVEPQEPSQTTQGGTWSGPLSSVRRGALSSSGSESHTPESFVSEVWQHAQKAAKELGVNVRALIAQAALETGWGKHGIKGENGKHAHNLFGIKASGWKGEQATTQTHEYRNGVRHGERANFRAYASVAESFADYVKLLKQNPRYQQALRAGDNVHGFASALQKAGYATDPGYASKITAIANSPTLKKALANVAGALQHP